MSVPGKTAAKTLKIGESRSSAVIRFLIWVALVAIYYVALLTFDSTNSEFFNNTISQWGLLIFPLLLTPYLTGIIRSISQPNAYVFDSATRELRKNRKTIIHFDEISALKLKAVNGTCEELTLSVLGENHTAIELPVQGPPGRVSKIANSIAALTNISVTYS